MGYGGASHTSLTATRLRCTTVVRQQEEADDDADMQHNSSRSTKSDMERWLKFFRLYRDMPQLWMTKSKGYRNRLLREQSYQRLLDCMRSIDPTANIHTLKRKINNFRTSYRRELRKVHSSDNKYVPTLWYFKELDFLCEFETGELQLEMGLDGDLPQLKSLETEQGLAPEPDVEDIIGWTMSMQEVQVDFIDESNNEHYPNVTEEKYSVSPFSFESRLQDEDMFAEAFDTETDALGDPEPEPDQDPEMIAADQTPIMLVPLTLKTEEHSQSHSRDYQTLSPQSMTSNANGLYSYCPPKHRHGAGSGSGRPPLPAGGMMERAGRPVRRRSSTSHDDEYFQFVDGEPSSAKQRRVESSYDHAESECVLIGKRMAAHFRNMRPDQRLFAERIISEVLVYGRMNQLSMRARFVPNVKDGAASP
ncbi:uncharacterized protein LOC108165467 isoform X1 [Drosophila miranda]|uniref:uncharacterized protein LOC108165467 isoform X1 n=1 Tax=Drosophila miranda TaxID=7229 RepID=UPI00143F7410|nr:uncharacterized protein LOC108165467 isoform X1 [Drosophila miranda]